MSNSSTFAKRALLIAVPVLAGLLIADPASAAGPGYYTRAQASTGGTVYGAKCSQCHGVNLEGGAGPALLGTTLKKYGTGSALYDFISRQMPADKPGSLSQGDYLAVTAYILSRNSYPAGDVALSSATLANVKLGAGNTAAKPKIANNNEIIRAAPSKNKVYGSLPAGADVNVTDAMMAAGDGANWLLAGRTYDNARYSPLNQITASNIGGLEVAGIAQTGMTASFETTPIVVNGVMYITTPTVDNKSKTMALDATNGRVIWDNTYSLGAFQICCGPVNRGAAVAYGMVYVLTLDDKLLALDARTGAQKWQDTVADPKVGYSETMQPIAYNGTVIVGRSAASSRRTTRTPENRSGGSTRPIPARTPAARTCAAARWCGRRPPSTRSWDS